MGKGGEINYTVEEEVYGTTDFGKINERVLEGLIYLIVSMKHGNA